jgi:hypothetical protein
LALAGVLAVALAGALAAFLAGALAGALAAFLAGPLAVALAGAALALAVTLAAVGFLAGGLGAAFGLGFEFVAAFFADDTRTLALAVRAPDAGCFADLEAGAAFLADAALGALAVLAGVMSFSSRSGARPVRPDGAPGGDQGR